MTAARMDVWRLLPAAILVAFAATARADAISGTVIGGFAEVANQVSGGD
jgi:hypothetical protein